MANNIKGISFTRTNGGLGRPLPGEDHISGLLFEHADIPIGFGTDRVKQILDLDDAESKGILPDSVFNILHYHVSEFFRVCPGATLFVGVFTQDANYKGIIEMQSYAAGKIRQFSIWTEMELKGSIIAALQERSDELELAYRYSEIVVTPNISVVTDLTTLPDLRFMDKPDVSVCIAQACDARGAELFESEMIPIGCAGAILGSIALAAVNECIGWVEKFNIAGTQLDVPAFANGMLVRDKESVLDTLDAKGYIYLQKYEGISGSYWNDSHTCAVITSDYAYIEANRTIKKSMRGVRTFLLPFLKSPITIDPNSGKLDPADIAVLQNEGGRALREMQRLRELSGYTVFIDPDQNILSTSELEIQIRNVPMGVIRRMKVKIGFTSKL